MNFHPETRPHQSSSGIFQKAMDGLRRTFAYLVIDLPGRLAGIDRLIAGLEKSGLAIDRRAERAGGRAANPQILAHIIGIECWGQRRLKVALGEPPVIDQYDDYRPQGQEWHGLREAFRLARQATISLSKSLRMAGIDPRTRVSHNQFGEITLLGWLFYLNLHAQLESKRLHG